MHKIIKKLVNIISKKTGISVKELLKSIPRRKDIKNGKSNIR